MGENYGCKGHKTIHDHRRSAPVGNDGMPKLNVDAGPIVAASSVFVWTCSDCGFEERWGMNWSWHGRYECKECGWDVIDRVSCGCKEVPPGEAQP